MFGKKLVDARAYNAMVKELAVLRADGLDEATELASFEWHARKVNDFGPIPLTNPNGERG